MKSEQGLCNRMTAFSIKPRYPTVIPIVPNAVNRGHS